MYSWTVSLAFASLISKYAHTDVCKTKTAMVLGVFLVKT